MAEQTNFEHSFLFANESFNEKATYIEDSGSEWER